MKFTDIQHCLYINLATREDRRVHVEHQLHTVMGLPSAAITRFNAIQLPKRSGSGAIGCSMSHLKCLETARKAEWPYVLIVEDDIEFTDPQQFATNFEAFTVKYQDRFDVCLIAGNNAPPFVVKAPFAVKVSRCQTTTGYLVMRHYYDTLIRNVREGIAQLMKDPDVKLGPNHWTDAQKKYSVDKNWFELQSRDQWYLITPLTVTQREDYSDIEERQTNYSAAMLNLDKANMFAKYSTMYRGSGASAMAATTPPQSQPTPAWLRTMKF